MSAPQKPLIFAEIGCNHMGDFDIAKRMIDIAAVYCKVDGVKFQKRCIHELLTDDEYQAPHPVPEHSYGKTYGEHREFLELTLEQHIELKSLCQSKGLVYASSVWDITSAQQIASLNPKFIKVPSAVNLNFEVLRFLCEEYIGELHISLGMTTEEEEEGIVDFIQTQGRGKDLVLYACTSGYPISDREICLLEVKRLCDTYQSKDRCKYVGFSGHHKGIAIDVAAMTLGARIIERHYTFDRMSRGTDHAASLEPEQLQQLVRDKESFYSSMRYKRQVTLLPVEYIQREKLKRIVAYG